MRVWGYLFGDFLKIFGICLGDAFCFVLYVSFFSVFPYFSLSFIVFPSSSFWPGFWPGARLELMKKKLEVAFLNLAPGCLNPQMLTTRSKTTQKITSRTWFSGLESNFWPGLFAISGFSGGASGRLGSVWGWFQGSFRSISFTKFRGKLEILTSHPPTPPY